MAEHAGSDERTAAGDGSDERAPAADAGTGAGVATGKLDRYRSMRDFGRTPEPSGAHDPARGDRFVVQEHHATALHWDFRLERDGVLVSWAVPKGIPPDPRENHLAVQTEDHPLDYYDFEGEIPEGEYGGGLVKLWDQGTYACEKFNQREVIVVLHGRRARGRYALVKTRGRNWLMHRMDPPEDPTREPLPRPVPPPLALPAGGLPAPGEDDQWAYEVAWGGERVAVASEGGRIEVVSAAGGGIELVAGRKDGRASGHEGTPEPEPATGAGTDLTERFPELSRLGRAIGVVAVVLEAELVVTGADGRPDGAALARRLAADPGRPAAVRRASERSPATLLLADVLWLEGHPTTALPFADRRRLLERLELAGARWQTVPSHTGDGAAVLAAARAQGLAGVVARRRDGPYDATSVRFVTASEGTE